MPVHSRAFRTDSCLPAPQRLVLNGALLQVEIEIPEALAACFASEGREVPRALSGWALIDTGARSTCVDRKAVESLGVMPVDVVHTQTPGGELSMAVYPTRFRFPGLGMEIGFQLTVGADLKRVLGRTSPDHVLMLLGRDILAHSILVYDGPSSSYTLGY